LAFEPKKAAFRFTVVAVMVALFLVVYKRGSMLHPAVHFEPGHFAIAPYLQLGRTGKLEDIEVVWGTTEHGNNWTLESRVGIAPAPWVPCPAPHSERISIEGVDPFTLFHAPLHTLIPAGSKWAYRLLEDGKPIFDAEGMPFHSGLQPWRFDVMGDTAAGSVGQRAVANAMFKDSKPDLLLIAGDIVYQNGRLSEYLRNFFPVYNADFPSPAGVPMMRSSVFVGAPGNHDTARGAFAEGSELDWFPDGLAYYELWKQPLNGPEVPKHGANVPNVRGSQPHIDAFLRASGESFPRMGSFSFDYGNAHFVVLDANLYMNWQDPKLRRWLDEDLQKAKLATWRFVTFHQPPFNADLHHYNEQQMRLISDILQRHQVDVVFAGHVHNYQRTRPLEFVAARQFDGGLIADDHSVDGQVTMDMAFDGATATKPHGIVYVITGCGGAALVAAEVPQNSAGAPKYSVKMLPLYSYTQCDIAGARLTVQQIDPMGKVLDRFEITKGLAPNLLPPLVGSPQHHLQSGAELLKNR
jgi:predicted phosphodiesterase